MNGTNRKFSLLSALLMMIGAVPASAQVPRASATPSTLSMARLRYSGNTAIVRVDTSRTFQTIEGFGATETDFGNGHLLNPSFGAPEYAFVISEADKQRVYAAVQGLGLTRARVHSGRVGAGWNAETVAQIKAITAGGRSTQWESVGDYPASVRSVDTMVPWILENLNYLRAQGIVYEYFSIGNEPGYSVNGWLTAEIVRDAIKVLGPQLRAQGFPTQIVLPDAIDPEWAARYTRVVMADPEARQYVAALASHLYNNQNMTEMAALAREYNVPLWMTEYSAEGLEWAEIVHRMLVDYSVSAVDGMNSYFGDWDKFSHYVTVFDDGNRNFTRFEVRPEGKIIAQWARYVRPGAVRVAATSSDPELKVSAFVQASRKTVVVVNSSDSGKQVLLAGDWSVTSTGVSAGVSSGSTVVPPRSVTTFVESVQRLPEPGPA